MASPAVIKTHLSKYPLVYSGKVRDLYEPEGNMLIVATDRISAFDYILPTPVPEKGKVLTQLSVFWFEKTKHLIPNHLISTDVSPYVANAEELAMLEGRSMIVKKVKRLDVEAIVRGYLTGSGWASYQKTGEVNGIKLPKGLRDGDKLPEPLFTPTTKAEMGDHDAPMTFDQVIEMLGSAWAHKIKEAALKIFQDASQKADAQGLMIADTKMEFGIDGDQLILIDELLTPDSSRFWLAAEYEPGKSPKPWDKQVVRDYLLNSPWDRKSPPPALPDEIVQETLYRYRTIAEKLMKV